MMDDALQKLKLLDYENRFCARRGFAPLSAHYFAVAGKPSEQFPYFSALVLWCATLPSISHELTLFRLLKEVMGVSLVEWGEFEVPRALSCTG